MFTTFITQPITNALVAVYQLLQSFGVPFAFGFAIILLTVIIRILIYPLISSQLKASKKMQELQPHLSRLKDLHKNDAQRLQQESLKLYKEFGVNPVAGCLPLLIQLPILWGLYSVLNNTVRATSIETINTLLYAESLKLKTLWDTSFFGLSLGQDPSQLLKTVGVVIFLVPIVTGVLQFIQSKMMMTKPVSAPSEKKGNEPDFASAMQMQTTYIIPVMIGFFSYTLPLGLSLYWNTFTIFGIIQQYYINKSTRGKSGAGVIEAEVVQSKPTNNTKQLPGKKKKKN